jgi:hypothetical protein
MNLKKRLKSLIILVFAFGFLFATVTTSCGNKKTSEDTEQSEHPSEGDEHPSGGDEHPKSDTTGGEHPSN